MIIAIDPGVKTAGVATHEDGELTSAFLVKGESALDTAAQVWNRLIGQFPASVLDNAELVVEKPQIYRQNLLRGDPNDLVDVAIMGSAIAARFHNVVWYLPRAWKGQMPKKVVERLIKEELSPEELARIELPSAKSLQHNVFDAVGIAIFHARRIRIKGLRPQ